jgi:3-mercaptopyruvate sulfurtransferase SseA
MRPKLYSLIVLAAAAIFAACNGIDQTVTHNAPAKPQSSLGPETTYADGARRVTTAELETLIKNGEVLVLDVRNQAMFDTGHIPGSKLIPAGEILNHVNELPRDKMIVTYCS